MFSRQKYLQMLTESGISLPEARVELDLLLEKALGITKKDIILGKAPNINETRLNELVNKRIQEKIPVQYLINTAWFMDEEFYVDENVLIPRPETEVLVEEVLKRAGIARKIIDVGTGSGCIGVILAKKLPQAEVCASDISQEALKIAKFNAKSGNIRFIQADILENIDEKFDIIVSNPPYIPSGQPVQEELRHEPAKALFVDDKAGVLFYKKLAEQAVAKLNPGGTLAVEIGIGQAEQVSHIFRANGLENIEIIKDMSGINRIIIGKLPQNTL